jgi:aspartyl-tRNA(Asn)/glutamyl-tRNA(Gln) amidotransferase subunit C
MDVEYVAKLARLGLTNEEKVLFRKQLGEVLHYIDKLKQVDVSAVEPSAHALPMFNVVRKDETRPGLTAEEALHNAPRKANNLFIVPKVIE